MDGQDVFDSDSHDGYESNEYVYESHHHTAPVAHHTAHSATSRHERWIDPIDEIQQAIASSLVEYESQPMETFVVDCMPTSSMEYDSSSDFMNGQSHDGLYLPASMARQVFGSSEASSHDLIVYKVTQVITIPSEDPTEKPLDLPVDSDTPVWAVLRGASTDSASYLNDGAIRQLCESGPDLPIKCLLAPVTTAIPMGSKVTFRPLEPRFIELKDQEAFMAGSIGKLHKILWPGQIISVYSDELCEIIRMIVQDVTADSMPEPPPDMLIRVTDCDLEINFDIPAEWFKKPDPVIAPPVSVVEEEPVARLTPAELRAQRLAYYSNKSNANN